MNTSEIILNYTCDNVAEHESGEPITAIQPLADITAVGTLICEECGEDMTLDADVTILPTAEQITSGREGE